MFEKLRKPWKHLIAPIARGLHALGITANAVTIIGAAGTVLAAIVTGVTGNLLVGSIVIAVLVMFDSLDGSVAQLEGGGTKFGAFLDSTLDRVADWAVLLGVIIYFFMRSNAALLADGRYDVVALVGMGAAIYAIMTSFVTSYIRARAESVGAEAKGGIATRSDRLTIILVGMAISGLTHQDAWLMATMCILALLGTITVGQRIHEARASIEATLDDADKD